MNARRYSAVYAVVVCVSVCVSVTLRYCIKTANKFVIYANSSFLMPQITAKFERDHPNAGGVG